MINSNNSGEEEWYFSIADVVQALTESADGRKYWNKLKQRLKEEGSQLVTNCHQLKMRSPKDGKMRLTDVANTEQYIYRFENGTTVTYTSKEDEDLMPG